jgi:transcriptional repressor OPI1
MQTSPPAPPDTPVPPYEPYLTTAAESPGIAATQDKINMMDLGQVLSASESEPRGPAAFSIDDLEVAKALTGLRAGMCISEWDPLRLTRIASPAQSSTSTTVQSPGTQSPPPNHHPEPLLSLLTSQHPLLATTINNSLSAYSSSKTYSPRFRQGAEFVERNLASPVANTVSTAGRISGVETGVRWMLRRHSSNNSTDGDETSNKRRRLDPDAMDIERGLPDSREREPSEASPTSEYLPAYDDNRSPKYEEFAVAPSANRTPSMQLKWQTRLMISTSGLGVAMSEESLRSLKYCLSWLRWANTHLNRVLASLQSVLEEWERSQSPDDDSDSAILQSPPLSPAGTTSASAGPGPHHPPRDAATIAKHLAALRAECLRTLKSALDVVSTYAGGSLPENARHLVRRHLTSLPMRFQLASSQDASLSQPGSAAHSRRGSVVPGAEGSGAGDVEARSAPTPEAVSGAQRVVVLAREGLDMMAQVSAVVDGTIVSAESWCERLGRRPRQTPQLGEEKTAPENQPLLAAEAEKTSFEDKPAAVHTEVLERDVTMEEVEEKSA